MSRAVEWDGKRVRVLASGATWRFGSQVRTEPGMAGLVGTVRNDRRAFAGDYPEHVFVEFGTGGYKNWWLLPECLAVEPEPVNEAEWRAEVTLDLGDPFESAVARAVELNRRKRADYALDSDPWSNFRKTAERMGMDSAVEAVRFNVTQKMVRLEALRANGRTPQNEAVADTWDDIAVYATIAGVLLREDQS